MALYSALKNMLIPWQDIDAPGNPLGQLGGFYRDIACGVRRASPNLFDGRLAGPFRPIGVQLLNRFWDNLCDTIPDDGAGQYPLGGQCEGVLYDLQAFDDNGSPIPWTTNTGGGAILGRMIRFNRVFAVEDPDNAGDYRQVTFTFENEFGAVRGRGLQSPDASYPYNRGFTAQFVRGDGLPDLCEELPPIIQPPDPPPVNILIPVLINGQRFSFPVNLPDLVVNNWPDFEFRPVFDLPDISFEITPEGINVPDLDFPGWPPIPPIDVNIAPTLNAIANLDANVQIGLGNINVEIGNIRGAGNVDLTEVLELIRCCACEEGTEYVSENVSGTTAGGLFPLPAGCVAVVVNAILPFTPKTPTISRSGGEPDVYLWGTYAIGYADGAAGAVERLSYDYQAIAASEAAATIVVTPHYGNACTIDAIIKVRNC